MSMQFHKGATITVRDPWQEGYTYVLVEGTGRNFHPDFRPALSPKEMLALGVFGGAYFPDMPNEFPVSWFSGVRLSASGKPEKACNYFGVLASQSHDEWKRKGWIHTDDPLGWFQWYCRYYLGRRGDDDERQIKRWNAMRRHAHQVVNNCRAGDESCRPRQRQALLHWAYDSRKM